MNKLERIMNTNLFKVALAIGIFLLPMIGFSQIKTDGIETELQNAATSVTKIINWIMYISALLGLAYGVILMMGKKQAGMEKIGYILLGLFIFSLTAKIISMFVTTS